MYKKFHKLDLLKYFFINFDKKLEHMSLKDPAGRFENLNETEKYNAEQMLLSRAFQNSFLLITKKKTFDEMLINGSDEGAILAHDPTCGITKYELENMMAYFVEEEEYEKCATIRDLITFMDHSDSPEVLKN